MTITNSYMFDDLEKYDALVSQVEKNDAPDYNPMDEEYYQDIENKHSILVNGMPAVDDNVKVSDENGLITIEIDTNKTFDDVEDFTDDDMLDVKSAFNYDEGLIPSTSQKFRANDYYDVEAFNKISQSDESEAAKQVVDEVVEMDINDPKLKDDFKKSLHESADAVTHALKNASTDVQKNAQKLNMMSHKDFVNTLTQKDTQVDTELVVDDEFPTIKEVNVEKDSEKVIKSHESDVDKNTKKLKVKDMFLAFLDEMKDGKNNSDIEEMKKEFQKYH